MRPDLEFDWWLTPPEERELVSEMHDRLVAGTYYEGYAPEDFLQPQ